MNHEEWVSFVHSSGILTEIKRLQNTFIEVTVGFEYETMCAGLIKIDDSLHSISYQRKRQVHQAGLPVRLTDHVSITGDYLVPYEMDPHTRQTITAYTQKVMKQSDQTIPLQLQSATPHVRRQTQNTIQRR
jgi:hypothetical protein